MKKKSRAKRKLRATPSTRRHEVKANLANFELAKARSSLTLDIYARGVKIGELEIGRGSLYWHGRSRKKSKRLDWSKFADKMDELAYGEKSSAAIDELVAQAPVRARRRARPRKKAGRRRNAAPRKKAGVRSKAGLRGMAGPSKKAIARTKPRRRP